MANPNGIKLQFGPSGYRMECGEEASEVVDYGDPLVVEFGGKSYIALVDTDDHDAAESLFGDVWVYCVGQEIEPEIEDVDGFEGDEEDDDDDDGGVIIDETPEAEANR